MDLLEAGEVWNVSLFTRALVALTAVAAVTTTVVPQAQAKGNDLERITPATDPSRPPQDQRAVSGEETALVPSADKPQLHRRLDPKVVSAHTIYVMELHCVTTATSAEDDLDRLVRIIGGVA